MDIYTPRATHIIGEGLDHDEAAVLEQLDVLMVLVEACWTVVELVIRSDTPGNHNTINSTTRSTKTRTHVMYVRTYPWAPWSGVRHAPRGAPRQTPRTPPPGPPPSSPRSARRRPRRCLFVVGMGVDW